MKKAADILRGIMSDQQAKIAGEWSSFFKGWQAIAGTDIAAHSSVQDVKHGTVLVEVDHPGWLQMIQLQKKKIIADMKKRYPELGIVDMRMVLYDGSARGAGGRSERRDEQAGGEGSGDGSSDKQRADIEETEEYRDFKAMLERLKKVRK